MYVDSVVVSSLVQLLAVPPLLVALWGASLFRPGNTGKGFAVPASSSNSAQKPPPPPPNL